MNLMELTISLTVDDQASTKIDGLSSSGQTKMVALGNIIANVFQSAMGVVSSSIGDAVSRVDTLNAYPKVMQSLGYSAEEAEASISRLSEGIDGLPTSLDGIVSITQKLAPMCDNLDEASDLAVALNNAMLAGGQGTQVANAAITQFTQMLAVGKVDMQAWNSVVTAAPGQMNQLAQSMLGAEANSTDLYNAIQEGTFSMDDLAAAVINLDQNGGDGFASFAEQAQSASTGIQTSFDNLQTAIVKNLANIIDTLQSEFNLSGTLDSVKGVINTIGSAINDNLPGAIQIVKDLATQIKDIAPSVAPVVAGIGSFAAGVAGLFAILSAGGLVSFITNLRIVQTAMAAWRAITTAVTAAQAALNLVMSANPLAIIVLAIMALIAAFATLYATNEDFRNTVNEIWNSISTTIGGVIESIVNFFTVDIPNAFNSFITFITSLPEQIATFLTSIVTQIGTWVSNLVIQAQQAGSGFVDGIVSFFSSLPGTISGFVSNIISTIVGFVSNLGAQALAAGQSFLENIQSGFNSAVSFVSDIPSKILNAIGDLGGLLINAGKSVIDGFLSGLKSAWNTVTGWFSDATASIASLKGPEDYDAKILIDNGIATIEGYRKGLEQAWGSVEGFLSDKTMDVSTSLSASTNTVASSNATSQADLLSSIDNRLQVIEAWLPSDLKINQKVVGRFLRGAY